MHCTPNGTHRVKLLSAPDGVNTTRAASPASPTSCTVSVLPSGYEKECGVAPNAATSTPHAVMSPLILVGTGDEVKVSSS
jgi:hypothetical protein